MDVEFGKETRHFLCGKKAIYNQEKNKYDLFGFSVDISDFKHAVAEVEKKEKLLLSIINNTRGGFILFKMDNNRKHFITEYSNEFAEQLLQLSSKKLEFNEVFRFLDEDFKTKISVENLCKSENFLETIDWKYTLPGTEIEKVYSLRFSTIKISANEVKVIAFIIDVTNEKKLIEQLELKLKENEVLIGEVHHRVKNNLAIIDGIIELKKSRTTDVLLSENLTDIQMRIKSIALVHQKLYQSGNFTVINLFDYINELSIHYKRLFDANNSKQIQFDIQIKQENTLSLTKSISFGLLLSELISNSCKYAIINNQVKIGICIKKQDDALIMNYTDSGNGLPENMKNFKNGGFGFRLIDNFIKQLKGKGTFPENNHFNFELEFTT
jgi:two-component sensor histidine kinase